MSFFSSLPSSRRSSQLPTGSCWPVAVLLPAVCACDCVWPPPPPRGWYSSTQPARLPSSGRYQRLPVDSRPPTRSLPVTTTLTPGGTCTRTASLSAGKRMRRCRPGSCAGAPCTLAPVSAASVRDCRAAVG